MKPMKLTPSQKQIYEMEKYAGGTIGILCGSLTIAGTRDETAVRQAIDALYRLNEALRLRILDTPDGPRQVVEPYASSNVEILRFEDKSALDTYAERYSKRPLDLYGSLVELKGIVSGNWHGILLKMHHIAGDAWTLSLVGNQFNRLMQGETPDCFSYADHVASEEVYLSSPRYAKDREFFLAQAEKCEEIALLGKKRTKNHTARRRSFVIKKAQAERLNAYSRANNLSPYVLFLTALSVYFHRVNMNPERFFIGTALLNRAGVRERNTMGMFVNTVPLLMDMRGDMSFAEALSIARGAVFAAMRHQKYNYGALLEALRSRGVAVEQLYDVMLSYQNGTVSNAESDFQSTWYPCGEQLESLQIHIEDRDSEGVFRLHFDYLSEVFYDRQIECLAAHLFNILMDGVEHDEKMLYALSMLTDDERNKLLFDFNDTASDYPRDKCVHELFEAQAARTPDKAAVIACDKTLTYRELNEQANLIARGLTASGVKRGDIVAFALPRNSRLIPTMLGILKAGAAYLPIDRDWPRERVEFILRDSGARLLLNEEKANALLKAEAEAVLPRVSPDDLCYCIYTSGTTGNPKGVLIRHSNVVNFTTVCMFNTFQKAMLDLCKYMISVGSITFDIILLEIYIPLLNGITVLLLSEGQIEKNKIAEILSKFDDYGLAITPTKLSLFMKNPLFSKELCKCSVVLCGAESFPKVLYNKLHIVTDAIIFNAYGPTETTCGVTLSQITIQDDITIGKPIANTQIYIVDRYLQPMPIGVTGELCVAGDGVGLGYLNRPELTAEKFIDNPFGPGKLYKTGDLAYWREDGNIVYVGRNDFQVKLRGLRVELGEIESTLSEIDGISQAGVVVRKDEEGRQLICAFYTGKHLKSAAIKRELGKRLPRYMLPHFITRLEAMPLTTSGKINRRALPEVRFDHITTQTPYVAPQGDAETLLAAAVGEVLGVDRVSIRDNYQELGGDSLKAIELISRLEDTGYSLDVRDVLSSEDLQAMAEKLQCSNRLEGSRVFSGELAATPAQLRIYIAQAASPDSTLYNVPYRFRTSVPIDPERLGKALQALVDRHAILHTGLESRESRVVQVIHDSATVVLEYVPDGSMESFMRPFDLARPPLLRAGWYEDTVMLDMHHSIVDGASMPLFLRELNELYMGREPSNDAMPYWQYAQSVPVPAPSDEAYWLRLFEGDISSLELNTDHRRSAVRDYAGSVIYESIDIGLHRRILNACRSLRITPFIYYLAAFNILLSKFSGCEDIVVGTPVVGRDSATLHSLGMFVNTLALRNQPDGDKTVRCFLDEVSQNALDAWSHQNYPYGDLVKKLGIAGGNRNPLFDVMFAWQRKELSEIRFGDRPAKPLPVPVTTSKYDFSFTLLPSDDAVHVMVEYSTALFSRRTVERYAEGLRLVLAQMLDADTPIREISAMRETERRKLLYEFNDTTVDYPRDKCVHELFEAQVARTPDRVAVIACDQTLTYRELNEQANRIACGLTSSGVKRGDIVAFALPRNSRLIPTMLGILKAGAAYLPIDRDWPRERVEFILRDSGARLLLNEEKANALLKAEAEAVLPRVSPDDLCYCIYTSGTTGNPKGVLIKHRNVVNYVDNNNINVVHNIINSKYKTIVSITTCVFDIFVTESILPIINGFSILLANEEQSRIQSELNRLITYHKADILQTTPTKMRLLIMDKAKVGYLKELKAIILGGEVLESNFMNMLQQMTNAKVYNIYGPTETTVWSTSDHIIDSSDITIGKPIANTQIYIIDRYLQPVPIGVTGELCVAGDGVGLGYLNRPELTAEKFIDNPFGPGKLYKTGDMAYWREDGNIVYVGRNDFQVKLRGLRVELGEIERALSEIDGVSQAAVVVRESSRNEKLLYAFYTSTSPIRLDFIREKLQERLPRYMVPHSFTWLSKMPLTTSGKINRRALPEAELDLNTAAREYAFPLGELEKAIADAMEKVLESGSIGRDDSFFDLGGDSLRAISLISNLQDQGIHITLQNVFDGQTVRAIAEKVVKGDALAELDGNDFTACRRALSGNCGTFPCPASVPIGNLLLTGATGFLGIHLLKDFLEYDTGKAWCIVRGASAEIAEGRLVECWHHFFPKASFDSARVRVIPADLSRERFGLDEGAYEQLLSHVDTVINAAASVKHYGSYAVFQEANVDTAARVVDFCKAGRAKLIHISTLSVSGNTFVDIFDGYVSPEELHFAEDNLFIGQRLNNVYTRSKLEAEKLILEATEKGLSANIMRMGNLTNRFSDGNFQMNPESNAFLQRVRSVLELGMIPEYLMSLYAEFTPVDAAARAVMLLARHFAPKPNVFHINNPREVFLDHLQVYFATAGRPVRTVSEAEFIQALHVALHESGREQLFQAFINDMDEREHLNYDSNIHIENRFTVEYLKQLGFEWPEIDEEYIYKYVDYLRRNNLLDDNRIQ